MRWYWGLVNFGLLVAGIGCTGAGVRRWLTSGSGDNVPWGHPWIALAVILGATLAMLATVILVARCWLRRADQPRSE